MAEAKACDDRNVALPKATPKAKVSGLTDSPPIP